MAVSSYQQGCVQRPADTHIAFLEVRDNNNNNTKGSHETWFKQGTKERKLVFSTPRTCNNGIFTAHIMVTNKSPDALVVDRLNSKMDGYKIVKYLGEGGFGQVVLAQIRTTKQLVAIKTIKKRAPDYKRKIELLREEAAILSTLDHVHIIRLMEDNKDGPVDYFVMEFCAGGDLRDAIEGAKSKSSIALRTVLNIFCQSILALQHCHHPVDGRTIIVHRDIKPENILLMPNGMVKLADFGLSRTLDISQAVAQSFVGTQSYLAPEILAGQPYDLKADMYSLGCVLFELVNLRLPDSRKRGIERTFDIIMPPGGSLPLQETITSLLASRPNRRTSTGDLLASSHFAQWVSKNIQEGSYVGHVTHLIAKSETNSTPESRSGRAQRLNERDQLLDEREAMTERRLGESQNREKRLSARQASLDAELNRYFLCHSFQYRRLLDDSDDRLAFRKSASPGQS